MEDLMIRIFIVAFIIQIILGATPLSEDPSKDWIDSFSIIITVLVVTNYKKEDIKSDDILIGDLIHVHVGDILPADLILVKGNGIQIDESALTGESKPLKKETYEKCQELIDNKKISKIPSPLMLSGKNCVEGRGYAVILAMGDHRQKGIIKRTIDYAKK